jgi:hypothetical protein
MRSMTLRAWVLVAAVMSAAAMAGCGSDDGGGSAPVVDDLSVTPTTVTAGVAESMTVVVTFSDNDGDLEEANVGITPEGGAETVLDPATIEDAAGIKAGQFSIQLGITLPGPGSYELRVWLTDGEGNKSKSEKITITAT